jgi:hypothetical protein
MKSKITKLAVKQNFSTILSLGYCDVQYLTYFKRPFGYSCGVNGWSCDCQLDTVLLDQMLTINYWLNLRKRRKK